MDVRFALLVHNDGMDKDLFDGVATFLAVAELRSFSRAADQLGVTPTAVSKAVRQLEHRHGVILFQRTTRSVALTEAGQGLFERLRPAAEAIDGAFTALDGYQDRPTGTLRLTLARIAMPLFEPMVAEYRRACPDVTLDLSLDDGFVDLMAGGFDAGVRPGEAIEKDMVAVRLTQPSQWSVVGAPADFARAGRPTRPEQLTEHEAIHYRFTTSGQIYRWEFDDGPRKYTVDVKGSLIVNDRAAIMAFARQGLGLVYAADVEIADDIAAGRLEAVLADHIAPSAGTYLYCPARTQTQPKLRAFIDLATRRAKG